MALRALDKQVQSSEKGMSEKLSSSEQFRLAKEAREGNNESCARLVLSMTRLILRRINVAIFCDNDINVAPDLLNGCYLKLFEVFYGSSAKFDPTKNTKPSTYAVWWIDKAINEELHKLAFSVGLSRDSVFSIGKLREENPEAGTSFSNTIVSNFARKNGIKPQRLIAAIKACNDVLLDAPIDGYDDTKSDRIADSSFSPEQVNREETKNTFIRKCITEAMVLSLSRTEADILRERYGLNRSKKLEWREICRRHKMSGIEVSRLEKESLVKMKKWIEGHPEYGALLGELAPVICS